MSEVDSEWRYTKTEPTPDELPDPNDDDGCKDCCSILFGALSLTSLATILLPVLIHKLRRSNDP